MTVHIPTPDDLRDTLVTILTGAAGGTEERWCEAIGEVQKLPTWANVRSNWRIRAMLQDVGPQK